MSNSFDPDQARRIVGPDLGPNCLPRLTADVIAVGNELIMQFATVSYNIAEADAAFHAMQKQNHSLSCSKNSKITDTPKTLVSE